MFCLISEVLDKALFSNNSGNASNSGMPLEVDKPENILEQLRKTNISISVDSPETPLNDHLTTSNKTNLTVTDGKILTLPHGNSSKLRIDVGKPESPTNNSYSPYNVTIEVAKDGNASNSSMAENTPSVTVVTDAILDGTSPQTIDVMQIPSDHESFQDSKHENSVESLPFIKKQTDRLRGRHKLVLTGKIKL